MIVRVELGFGLKEYRLTPLMSATSITLKRCSKCKCTLLLDKYFEINRKGEYYKTCNGCRATGKQQKAGDETQLVKCIRCRCVLPIARFETNRDGEHYKSCNSCRVAGSEREALQKKGVMKCNHCRCEKSLGDFDSNGKGGLLKSCNECREKVKESRFRYVEPCMKCGAMIPVLSCVLRKEHLRNCFGPRIAPTVEPQGSEALGP